MSRISAELCPLEEETLLRDIVVVQPWGGAILTPEQTLDLFLLNEHD